MPLSSKILTIGSMTVDLFIRPDEINVLKMCRADGCNEEYMTLPYGGKVQAGEVHEHSGGGAHNTAVGLARLGLNTAPIGCIGKGARGQVVLDNIQKEKVSAEHIQYCKDKQTGFSVILNSFEGERTVIYHPGANQYLENFDDAILDECGGIFFNRVSAKKTAEHIFPQIKRHFLQYPEKFLAWNPGKEQLSSGALAFADFFPVVDILLLNREEAELFTGRKAHKKVQTKHTVQKEGYFCSPAHEGFPEYVADYSDIFRVFIQQGVQNIVITDGRNGAQLCDGKHIYFCGINEQANRVDTLGAGDGFGSGLFAALFRQKELSFALKCATINAASVVSHLGAQTGLLSWQQLEKQAHSVPLLQAQKLL